MTFESMISKMGAKQIADRYADYGTPIQEPQTFYTYEQPQEHVEAASKHTYGGGHKSHAAMSALTLLAFLFFLHILQQCIKEHMTVMTTPQITIMTAGREGETPMRTDDEKLDKTGLTHDNDDNNENVDNENNKNGNENIYLMKINTAEPPRYSGQSYMSEINYGNRKPNLA